MTIDRIPGNFEQPQGGLRSLGNRAEKEAEPVVSDQVTISGKGESFPKIIVGVPTARLDPHIDTPRLHPTPIGIEIKDGVAIGIDGQSLIVGQGKEGTIEIDAHSTQAAYPQRDFKVTREGEKTVVDGYFNWQDATITGKGNNIHIAGETPRESFDVAQSPGMIVVKGQWPVQNYTITEQGPAIDVKGAVDTETFNLATEGNVTTIQNKSGYDELNYVVTRKDDHSMHVEGKLAYQKFDITWDDSQMKVKGYYPHQDWTIKFS